MDLSRLLRHFYVAASNKRRFRAHQTDQTLLLVWSPPLSARAVEQNQTPNFVVIFIDDMGYGDIGDPYVLTVHVPPGFRLAEAVVEGEKVEVVNQEDAAAIRVVPSATKTVSWEIKFQ